jgi:hypothetical protein
MVALLSIGRNFAMIHNHLISKLVSTFCWPINMERAFNRWNGIRRPSPKGWHLCFYWWHYLHGPQWTSTHRCTVKDAHWWVLLLHTSLTCTQITWDPLTSKIEEKKLWLDHQLLFITWHIAHFKSWTDLCQQQTSTLPPKWSKFDLVSMHIDQCLLGPSIP